MPIGILPTLRRGVAPRAFAPLKAVSMPIGILPTLRPIGEQEMSDNTQEFQCLSAFSLR